jgi:hypothetical protein
MDIIVVTKDEFLKAKETISTNEKINKTYTELFKTYDCFYKIEPSHHQPYNNTTQINPGSKGGNFKGHYNSSYHKPSKNNSSHKNNRNQNPHRNHQNNQSFHHSSKPITKIFDGSLTNDPLGEMKRKLKGLLNIINKNNYKKVISKIKALITIDNAKDVYEILLATTCTQVFYIAIFINIIMDLTEYMIETKQICDIVLNEFIENFIYNREYISSNVENHDDYDMFCAQQKQKCLITAKNLVIIELLNRQFSKVWSVQTYADHLIKTLDELYQVSFTTVSKHLEMNTDMILTMIKDLKSVQKNKHVKIDTKTVGSILNKQLHNQRIQFMAQDIFDMEFV